MPSYARLCGGFENVFDCSPFFCGFLKRFRHLFLCDTSRKGDERGALILEYVLLLMGCVALALVVRSFFSLGEEPGVFIAKWKAIIELIGSDM